MVLSAPTEQSWIITMSAGYNPRSLGDQWGNTDKGLASSIGAT